MKKFTEIERNLITVILDGRRNDYKKEHDFEKVFGRNATIDLAEGRTFLLDDALFGADGAPEIIYDLLYETECDNVSFEVMINALEAAVNGDWENVPDVEEAIELTDREQNKVSERKLLLREFFESVRKLNAKSEETGANLAAEVREVEGVVLSGLVVWHEGIRAYIDEFLSGAKTLEEIVDIVYELSDWDTPVDFDNYLVAVLEAIKNLFVKSEGSHIELLFDVQEIEALALYLADISVASHDRLDGKLADYYERDMPLNELMDAIKGEA
ncbi:hypothetical protein ABEY13_06370 [Bacillus velezensis]|uniref:hypothetical protein n=1 Tax=Bacillus velezensis TaxID=492670 RepID=UPI002DBE82A2|nr:hypothetical protein [Bacillus velezensis]MEC3659221.1 hypothetical protein [Bacillus velezensis]MEC3685459.1 hypothetical protein [Bacillus velezensis]MEC3788409.1 hypothetical protein [Bacillus velezensis]MEC3848666.1 hypothetical protein [Bacillus velezensis]